MGVVSRSDEVMTSMSLGLIPVALCIHDGEAVPVPIRALTSKLGFLLACTICGHVHVYEAVSWHTTDYLTKRFGWEIEDLGI